MTSVFLFALILGGGLLGLSLLGDLFGTDADLDTDLDTDLDADLGVQPDMAASPDLAGAIQIFTIRNLTYFLFGFGAIGWLLVQLNPALPLLVVTLAALAGGGLAAGIAALVFGWLKATDTGGTVEEDSFIGCEGRVVLPLSQSRIGQIIVRRGDREHELRALPFDPSEKAPERWRNVVVIEMDGGTARVSSLEALAPAEAEPANPEEETAWEA